MQITDRDTKTFCADELARRLKQRYEDYLYLVLIPEDRKNVAFYEQYGFSVMEGGTPMQVLTL